MALFKALRLKSAPVSVQKQNQERWNKGRSLGEADFFTIGYVGKDGGSLIKSLSDAGVETVVDIRFTPISQYKPQFSKGNLRRLLNDNGIEYLHRPDLGVPRDVRGSAVDSPTRDPIWEWYDEYVVTDYVRNLTDFFNMQEHPVAFLCVEADPTSCHRHRLSLALERVGLTSYDL